MLRAHGTNCDFETQVAFEQAGAEVDSALVTELFHREKLLADYQILVSPGGFTYGDDISAGKILANELKLKLREDIQRFVEDGRLILGICNGFQVLVKAAAMTPANLSAAGYICRSMKPAPVSSPGAYTPCISRLPTVRARLWLNLAEWMG